MFLENWNCHPITHFPIDYQIPTDKWIDYTEGTAKSFRAVSWLKEKGSGAIDAAILCLLPPTYFFLKYTYRIIATTELIVFAAEIHVFANFELARPKIQIDMWICWEQNIN